MASMIPTLSKVVKDAVTEDVATEVLTEVAKKIAAHELNEKAEWELHKLEVLRTVLSRAVST